MIATKEILYKNAYFELNEIIKVLPVAQKNRIPQVFLEQLQNQMQINDFVYDSNKNLLEQNMLTETKALLVEVYNKFLATPSEQTVLNEYRNICIEAVNKEKKMLYNVEVFENDKVSKKELLENSNNDFAMISVKNDSIFRKIYNKIIIFIKKLF